MRVRKICYVSGTRADYGLMREVLRCLQAAPDVDLSICVTGMHLSPRYGNTVDEIEAEGLTICAKIPVDVDTCSPGTMCKSIGHEIIAMTEVFEKEQPDIVLLLGDRGEMLAAALAAIHLNCYVVHVHGGERSGTVDEMVRHAVSKFSHYHFVATEEARQRLIRMGEHPESVYQVGAPGLDEMNLYAPLSRETFCQQYQLDAQRPVALLVFHPVVQEYDDLQQQFENVILAALNAKLQLIILEPNSDAGRYFIQSCLDTYRANHDVRIVKHLQRLAYLDCLANVDIMLGNSSSGIIEAATYHLPVVNVGSRQNLRERSDNVIDVDTNYEAIFSAINTLLAQPKRRYVNIYGDGKTSQRCYELLTSIRLEPSILNKCNAY